MTSQVIDPHTQARLTFAGFIWGAELQKCLHSICLIQRKEQKL